MAHDIDKSTTTVIRTYPTSFEANIALTRLRAAGIRCALTNELISEVWALPTARFDSVRLMVKTEDAERANDILNELHE